MEYGTCNNREQFASELAAKLIENPSSIYCFIGEQGVGKEYVIDLVENKLYKKFKLYRIIGDNIYGKQIGLPKLNITLEASVSIRELAGLALSVEKNDSTKINYVIASLKSATLKKNLLLTAVNFENLSSEGREFLSILINNHDFIEMRTKKKIAIVFTSRDDCSLESLQIKKVRFQNYTPSDIRDYLQGTLNCPKEQLTTDKLQQIYKLCGTNLDLVGSYYKYILESDAPCSIDAIVDQKKNYYISSGCKYNLSRNDLESILFIAADSISCFTPHMIYHIEEKLDVDNVERGVRCAEEAHFFELDSPATRVVHDAYLFISNAEKAILCNRSQLNRKNVCLKYYNYLSIYAEEEYFVRAQYIFHYFGELTDEVFSLLVLALGKAHMMADSICVNKTLAFVRDRGCYNEQKEVFEQINEAYNKHYQQKYKCSSDILRHLNFETLPILAAIEVRRLDFKNGELGHFYQRQDMKIKIMILKTYVDKGIFLFHDTAFGFQEEHMLELRIIFDIAPYVLDVQNDVETFNKLYDKSLVIQKSIDKSAVKRSYSEYIINIFNRKAFLFAPPSTALVYYEQAEAYFRKAKIDSELAITLASKAGINISLRRYGQARKALEESLRIIDENKLTIQQKEKIYNNLYLVDFLEFEEKENCIECVQNYATTTIAKLEKLLSSRPCGKNHVILTNIASLYLYNEDIPGYIATKKKIQRSLDCNDVSDVLDETINDFYRYHFAWFEFYRSLVAHNWEKCALQLDQLKGFYPSIFHDTRKMELRVIAGENLVNNRFVPSVRDYCINFLKYSNKPADYVSRGLLLSDLQFTSFD